MSEVVDLVTKETIMIKSPVCLLCSSQENYCFNSEADVFALIEINQRKKAVRQWFANCVFLDRTEVKDDSRVFICEVHYAKEDLVRGVQDDGTCVVRLFNEHTVPSYVKLEARALSNRINSFLFLVEDYEKCLNLGRKWKSEVMNDRLVLTLGTKAVRIEIEDNLVVKLEVDGKLVDTKFAIVTGYLEANERILFWSRLRGLMKYYEEKEVVKALTAPKEIKTSPPVAWRIWRNEMPVKLTTNSVYQPVKNPLTPKILEISPKKEKPDVQEPQMVKGVSCVVKSTLKIDKNLVFPTKIKSDPDVAEEQPETIPVYDPDVIYSFVYLTQILQGNRRPNWHVIVTLENACALEIVMTLSQTPYILKALKANHELQVSAYINGKNVINHLINKTPGKLSRKEVLSYLQSIDRVPVKFPKSDSLEPEIKQEKLDFADFLPGCIPTFDILVDNLRAFDQNDWHPVCINETTVLIFKVDIADLPKFKRYIKINRNLEITIFNNGRIISLQELHMVPFVLYPLTLQKIHMILAHLDETVFDKILRPSKYRSRSEDCAAKTNASGIDHRVVPGIKKKHKCSICEYESHTLNYVKQHYEIKHTPPDRKCPECGKEMNATQLKIHARFHIKKVRKQFIIEIFVMLITDSGSINVK